MYKASFKSTPISVGGNQPKVGDKAPDFTAVKNDLSTLSLSQIPGLKIISSVPSLDTGVCSIQTARFFQECRKNANLTVITVSKDLPFAQARWCAAEKAEGNDKFIILSDYKDGEFAKQYGLLINELGLLSRAVIVIDQSGIIRYIELLEEIANEPNYAKALEAVSKL